MMIHKLDSHTHTIASGHAYNTIDEMAKAAADKGLELLAITDHSMAMPGTAHLFYFVNLKVLPRTRFGIEVLYGAEVNIMDYDGGLDMEDSLLGQMDVVVASMHMPCVAPGSAEQNTRAFLQVMDNPFVNIIGHPDDSRYPVDFDTLVPAAKEKKVLLELNNSSLQPFGSRRDPLPNDIRMLELCMKYRTPIIVDSDAHCSDAVGGSKYAYDLIEELNFPQELIVNRSVEEYKKYINRFKHRS